MRGLSSKIMMQVAGGLAITVVVVAIYLSSALKESTVENSIINADDTISQFQLLRGYYTNNVVAKIKGVSDLQISSDHKKKDGFIPLPATMIHDLSQESGTSKVRSKVKLYSAFPFPNRKDRELDAFGKGALAYFQKNPEGRYVQEGRIGNQDYVRVARADRMSSQTCVGCHNSHPETPKSDWSLGDVRGVLEVSTPISAQLSSNKRNLYKGIFVFILAGFGVVGGLYLSVNKVIRPIRKIMDDLSIESDNLLNASSEISNLSQGLSQSTTVQASNIEETAKAMHHMASMSNQNSEHAASANGMVNESHGSLETSGKAVNAMTKSMADINAAFEKITTIVRSIDEISFETNLLSLNASLEATDAGESGRRFSVVADEVRALSDKASEAARETVELISGANERIQAGNSIASSLKESFGRVQQGAVEVAELVAEIKADSKEQAQGCEQVNRALGRLDEGTQGNASSAEQASVAADKLAQQANDIRKIVSQLNGFIGRSSISEGVMHNVVENPHNIQTQQFASAPVPKMKISPSLVKEMSNLSKIGIDAGPKAAEDTSEVVEEVVEENVSFRQF